MTDQTDAPTFEHTRAPTQIYLISPQDVAGDFPDRLAAALDAGLKGRHRIAAFQFRVKGVDEHTAARLAAPLQALCAEREIAFIVNDSISLAKRLGADGVHLGQEDMAQGGGVKEAREALGREAQIGVTCHASRHLAMDAGEAGADYVAFGAFYPTTTKQVEHHAEPDILTWWQSIFEIPAWRSAASRPPMPRRWCARAPISSRFRARFGRAMRRPTCWR
jgi:thiamine-phosphate pyrophosphorylase